MAKNVDVLDKVSGCPLPTLSREELYDFSIAELSEFIMSIEQAIRYTEGYRFLFFCFGSEESSDKAKMIVKVMEGYLEKVKDVYRFKVSERKKRAEFLKGEIF